MEQPKRHNMKRTILLLSSVVVFTFCKGPGSGPLVRESFDKSHPTEKVAGEKHQARIITARENVKVDPCPDCLTIAGLLQNKKEHEGKVVKVKGQVTKYNAGILGKNWIHIQDGTEYKDGFDLTVTTEITSAIGEVVTFEGKISLDRDFGYGYRYDVIMEDARAIN
jgi:hypothetical protein